MIRRRERQSSLALFGVILALVALAYGSSVADSSISILDVAVQTLSQSSASASASAATPITASTSTTRRHSFDVDVSLNSNLHSQRHLQEEVLNNFTASYVKCYSLIDEVAFGADAMTQDQYLEFLRLLTDGALSFDRFADLPAVYVMIFYTAACIEEGDCEPDSGSPPQVQLGDGMVNGDNPTDAVALFCKQILKSTSSSAEAVFDYSIRYNPDRIAQQDLAICLSTATVNVLLEELANCPLLAAEGEGETPSERRRRLLQWQSLLPTASSGSSAGSTLELTSANPDDRRRGLQEEEDDGSTSLGSVATPDESSCKYAIESTVDRLTELPCDEVTDVSGSNTTTGEASGNEVCGLVRSTATVSASLLLEPFDELLRIKAVNILRRVINGGEFLTYLPDACLLV